MSPESAPEDAASDVVVAPLLDLDPALATDLTPALREQVRGWLVVRVLTLPRGPWPTAAHREPGLMGFLVLDGVLTRNVSLGKIAYPELLGRGDLLRPWQTEAEGRLGPVDVTWQVLEPCRVAVLDRRFAGIVGRWPEIVDELLGRALNRARELDYNMAIAQLPLLELRLLALLWRLADRWGEPTEDGVSVPIRLTHSLLAAMVLGRRPVRVEHAHRALAPRPRVAHRQRLGAPRRAAHRAAQAVAPRRHGANARRARPRGSGRAPAHPVREVARQRGRGRRGHEQRGVDQHRPRDDRDRDAVGGPVDDLDRVARADLALAHDAQVRAGPPGLGEALDHLRVAEAQPELEARQPRLAHLELDRADPPALADHRAG